MPCEVCRVLFRFSSRATRSKTKHLFGFPTLRRVHSNGAARWDLKLLCFLDLLPPSLDPPTRRLLATSPPSMTVQTCGVSKRPVEVRAQRLHRDFRGTISRVAESLFFPPSDQSQNLFFPEPTKGVTFMVTYYPVHDFDGGAMVIKNRPACPCRCLGSPQFRL